MPERGRAGCLLGTTILCLLVAACVGGLTGALPVWAAVVVGAAGVLLILLRVTRALRQVRPARAAASAFLEDLVAGRLSAASYPRHDAPVDDAGALVIKGLTDEGRQVSGYHMANATMVGLGHLRAEVNGWARLSTSEVVPFQLLLARRADAWKVIAVSAQAPQ
jgi:hypothetical protein